MGAYRKRGGKKGKSFLLGIGRRAFQTQPEAPFTPAAALRGVLQAGRSPQKGLGGDGILHHRHIPAKGRLGAEAPQLHQPLLVFRRVGDIGIAEKQRNGEILGQVLQYIRGARRAAGMQQQRRTGHHAQPLYCFFSLPLEVRFFHFTAPLFHFTIPIMPHPAPKEKPPLMAGLLLSCRACAPAAGPGYCACDRLRSTGGCTSGTGQISSGRIPHRRIPSRCPRTWHSGHHAG